MKAFATIGLGSLGSISIQHAIRALPADRPHGVAPEAWVRLDEKVGLVIGTARPGCAGISGTFMVKQDGVWQPLVIEPARAE